MIGQTVTQEAGRDVTRESTREGRHAVVVSSYGLSAVVAIYERMEDAVHHADLLGLMSNERRYTVVSE